MLGFIIRRSMIMQKAETKQILAYEAGASFPFISKRNQVKLNHKRKSCHKTLIAIGGDT